jgi:acyl-CoA thioesterase-1
MSRRPRIVALADSLALPRDEKGEVLRWEETWPYLLAEQLAGVDVINCGARARSSDQLLGDALYEHVALKRPDVVVVQVGIVDCSPRVFTKLEKRLLGLPVVPAPLRQRIIAHRAARRAEITRRDPLGRVHTPPADYARDVARFAQEARPLGARVVFLPVLSWPARMELKSPGHGGNVRLYNDLLRTAAREQGARFLEPEALVPEAELERAFMADGYHLSAHGSRRVAEHLAPELRSVLSA